MDNSNTLSNQFINETEYIETRVLIKINSLLNLSRSNRHNYVILKIIQIIFLLVLPCILFINVDFNNFLGTRTVAIFVSIGALGAEVALSVFRFYELWFKYRGSARTLERIMQD